MDPDRWRQIKELFGAALEKPPEKRSEFLAEACAGDATLCSAVKRLIADHDRAGEFLNSPPWAKADEGASDAQPDIDPSDAAVAKQNSALQPVLGGSQSMRSCPTCNKTYPPDFSRCPRDGATLAEVAEWSKGTVIRGKYEILAKLGHGGMGAVYKVTHRGFDEIRALKVMLPEAANDPAFVKRFLQEAFITRKLQHPNAVRVDDIDEAEDGRPFIVMEFIEGRSLKNLIRDEAPLAIPRTCIIIKQVADALDAAHRLGMVHRDIKPDNIFLENARNAFHQSGRKAPMDAPQPDECAKVLDFGIAKLKEVRGIGIETKGLTISGTGMVIGTPRYMSPEQARGLKGEQLDGRADLYSLGVVMYEMLTGALPLEADTTMELLMAHVQTPPRPIQEVRPELRIPDGISNLVMQCLEKDRDERPASARALIEEIERFELSHPIPATFLAGQLQESPTSLPEGLSPASERAGVQVGATSSAAGRGGLAAVAVAPKPGWTKRKSWAIAVGGLGFVLIALLIYFQSRPLPPPKVSGYVPLTRDGVAKSLLGTDGARLYYQENQSVTSVGVIAQVSGSGGEVARIAVPSPTMRLLAVSPDGATLLVADDVGTAYNGPLWAVPVLGGSPRRLGEAAGQVAAWSPDGQMMVYANVNDLFLAKSDGAEPHKLVSAPDVVTALAWSPDGTVIRFSAWASQSSLWQVSIKGTSLHPLLPAWHTPPDECCGRWTPDGRHFVFNSKGNIWAIAEKGKLLGNADGQPWQLTSGPMTFSSPLPSKDGKKLFVVGALARGEMVRYDAKSAEFVPFLSGISAQDPSFSNDGQWVAYVSYPEGTLWKSKLDGSQRLQLSYPPLFPMNPRLSPDGKKIAFFDASSSHTMKLFVVSTDGGAPREIIPEDLQNQWEPNWSPDGTRIVFGGAFYDPSPTIPDPRR